MPSMNIERCFQVLEILCDHSDGLALGDIAEKADIPKSATHRMLSSLCSAGYVTQTRSKSYRMSLLLPSMGLRFLSGTQIMDDCQEVLDDLAAKVGELVRMCLVDESNLIWVAKAQGSRNSLMIDPVMGHKVALHATATGKVWLASLSTETALTYVLRDGFGKPDDHGPSVIQTVEELQADLTRTRKRGYGLAIEEADPGIVAIATGIPGTSKKNEIVGTVSIAGPHSRLSKKKLVGMLPELQAAVVRLKGIDVLIDFVET